MNGWMVASWLITDSILCYLFRRPEASSIAAYRHEWVWVAFAVACLAVYLLAVAPWIEGVTLKW